MITRLLAGIVATVMLIGVAVAGPFENAGAAYNQGDYATALRLWQPLAEQGNASGQFNLGVMYERGEGVPPDYRRGGEVVSTRGPTGPRQQPVQPWRHV